MRKYNMSNESNANACGSRNRAVPFFDLPCLYYPQYPYNWGTSNCQNDYPYAMAYKRLFDRVVLKLSKLAYSGIYSDSESEEFSQQLGATNEPEKPVKTVDDAAALVDKHFPQVFCQKCSNVIEEYLSNDKSISPEKHAAASKRKFGRVLCLDCIKEINDENAG